MGWGDWLGTGWTGAQVALAATAAAALAAALLAARRSGGRRAAAPDDAAWRRSGQLLGITCYPIKSCAGVDLQSADCSVLGLRSGFLRDRVFMVVREGGDFVTGRIYPRLTQIVPVVEGSTMTLSTPGMPDIAVDIAALHAQPRQAVKARVWGQTVQAVDCGDAVAAWLSRALLSDTDVGLRLVYYPDDAATRLIKHVNKLTEKCQARDTGAFPDETSYSLMSSGSLAELNGRLARPVSARQFRLNLLVEAEPAFAEDGWSWVRVGDAVFQNTRPCTRCLFTTVDPDSGAKTEDSEPLTTLKTYRMISDPAVARYAGNSPAMGIHLALNGGNSIAVGDPVYVQ